jgi:LytS/YehU family sensor histidine kinase
VAAQLQNLKMQLQPHFLFNTLNSVMALMDEDVKAAQTMVARLAEFLRATLDLPADGLISLTRELHLAALYLQIEGVRFSDRLRVTLPVVVDPPDFRLPALILQPLLENAVKHGIAPHARGGEIRVGVETHADRVEVLVRNSGSGPVRIETGGSGLGLSLVRRRLDPCGGSLEVGFIEEGGYEARIRLPRRP